MDSRIALDAELLIRYASGDISAFDALYEHYAPLLRTWTIAMLGGTHRNDVEDIIQQVFSDFHARRHETIPYVRGYLHNLLHYRLTNHVLACKRLKRTPIRETHGYEVAITDDPTVRAEQNETARLLRSLVSQLPERERNCVEQVHMAGRSCHELAAEINTHVNNVKRWTRQGLARLRRAYNRQCQN